MAGKEDEVGIKKAHQLVEMLIEEEVKAGIPSERIMLALYMPARTGGRDCNLLLLLLGLQHQVVVDAAGLDGVDQVD